MIGIILVGHGEFPLGLKHAAELIMGPQEAVTAIPLRPGESPQELSESLEAELAALGSRSCLILADLVGGSPFTTAAQASLQDPSVQLVGGVNLGMLLEVLQSREHLELDQLVKVATEAGRQSILALKETMGQ